MPKRCIHLFAAALFSIVLPVGVGAMASGGVSPRDKEAQLNRIAMEKQAGLADRQRDLAGSEVDITIKENRARARKSEADGEATYIEQTGRARGAEIEAVGLARAKGFEAQKARVGEERKPFRAGHPGDGFERRRWCNGGGHHGLSARIPAATECSPASVIAETTATACGGPRSAAWTAAGGIESHVL